MRLIFYNPNAKGGNFDYALRLTEAYKRNSSVKSFVLVLPVNANISESDDVHKILLSDQPAFKNRVYSRFYFVWRTFINPLKFFFFLLNKKGYVILNDFDQTSSFLWVPLYSLLKQRFVFSVILHDPDRDQYFRSLKLSQHTMQKMMSIVDIAFYHEILPQKTYYKSHKTVYVSVPHGLYNQDSVSLNQVMFLRLEEFKGSDFKLLGAIGNIREEKNYKLIIKALKQTPEIKLLIAGLPANSSIDMGELRFIIATEQLTDRVIIIEKYLDDEEIATIGKACEAFVLYYANSFKSQSGVLNLLAPLRKTLLVSDNGSPLSLLVRKFNLGLMAKADDENGLVAMLKAFAQNNVVAPDWDGYFAYASWENHVNIALDTFSNFKRK